MSQENNTTPSARNREAYAALTEMGGNVPPQAVELEEAVLGALMLEKDSIITVQEFVTPRSLLHRGAPVDLPRHRGAVVGVEAD